MPLWPEPSRLRFFPLFSSSSMLTSLTFLLALALLLPDGVSGGVVL